MPRRKSRTLTELELEIMQTIWQLGEATVEQLYDVFQDSGKPLARPSIRTMLKILQQKQYLTRTQEGRGYVYHPEVSAPEAHRSFLSDLLERAFDGSATSMVATLLHGGMISNGDLKEVKQLIRQHEGGKQK